MDNLKICEELKELIPATRNAPQIMNTFMVLLQELNKSVMRINELKSDNKLVLDLRIEPKDSIFNS